MKGTIMAKKRGSGPNKSEIIREYADANPSMKPKELSEKIKAEKGLDLTPGFISTIKSQYKKKGPSGGKRRGRKPGAAPVGRPAGGGGGGGSNDTVSFALLKAAKELSVKLGGIDKARKILDALAELS
jgi:hypothetical protein